MKRLVSRVRGPVRRAEAGSYLLLTLLSFALSVSLTRLFLDLTGYPQLGGGEFHIAHVLWGGLLLFIAVLITLILANRWAYRLSAVLAGVGVGLFIDEVGKFITQSNNYFYPAAAPIVYALFLLTVLVYVRVRKPPRHTPREALYQALDQLQELLDHDLDPVERADLEATLSYVADQRDDPDLAVLSRELLEALRAKSLRLAPIRQTFWDRVQDWLEAVEARYFGRGRIRVIIVGGLLLIGGLGLYRILPLFEPGLAADRLQPLIELGRIGTAQSLAWYAAQVALEASVGVVLLVSAVLLATGHDRRGSELGFLGLVLALTTVDLLVFYFQQFGTILKAAGQLALLLVIMRYRVRFLSGDGGIADQSLSAHESEAGAKGG